MAASTVRTCKPQTGTVRVISPLGTLPGQPDAAEIVVNNTRYLCRCTPQYVELVKACGEKDSEPQVYHLAPDLTTCDCADATYRRRRCKHQGALLALRDAGKL